MVTEECCLESPRSWLAKPPKPASVLLVKGRWSVASPSQRQPSLVVGHWSLVGERRRQHPVRFERDLQRKHILGAFELRSADLADASQAIQQGVAVDLEPLRCLAQV